METRKLPHPKPRGNNQAPAGWTQNSQNGQRTGSWEWSIWLPFSTPLLRQVRQGLKPEKNRKGAPRYLLGSLAHQLPGQHSHRVPAPVPQWQPSGESPHLTTPHPVHCWKREAERSSSSGPRNTLDYRSHPGLRAKGSSLGGMLQKQVGRSSKTLVTPLPFTIVSSGAIPAHRAEVQQNCEGICKLPGKSKPLQNLVSFPLLSWPSGPWHQFSTHFRCEGRKQRKGRPDGAELFLCLSQAPSSHPGDPGDWGGGAVPSLVGTMLVSVTSSGLRPPFSFRLIVLCVSKDHSCGDST